MPKATLRPADRRGRAYYAMAALLACAISASAMAQQPTAASPRVPPAPAPVTAPSPPIPASGSDAAGMAKHVLDATDLASWLDGFMWASLKQGNVAGAVVSVVQDGHVLLAKGYGYADVSQAKPMNGDQTLIRAGSTSKLFTWTAVMQLAEQGKLDLNADINRYLDFKIPEPYGRHITLNDLMTHTAGFEEGLKDALVTSRAQMQPLGVFLALHIRPVLFPPGEVPAYSNYGAALAGYIVQRVSGEPFEDYVARHIFAPLHMRHSTFAQPLPPALAADMSRGYRSAAAPPLPFEIVNFAPAGGLSSTAADMANFMIAQLSDGSFDGAEILHPETTRFMHTPSRPYPEGFDAMAHGFFAQERNGRMVLGHGGDTVLFHSDLEILPQVHTGIFVSFNSRGEDESVYGIRDRLIDGFLDRYFPGPAASDQPALADAAKEGARIAGRYETSRRVQSGFMSLFYVLQGQDVVSVNPDATISLSSAPGKRFREVQPDLWREVGGFRLLKLTTQGGVRTIADSRNPVGVLQAVPLMRNAGFNGYVFVGSLLLMIGAALAWPISAIARRLYRQPPPAAGRLSVARRLARLGVVADLAYLLAWGIILKPILNTEVSFYTASLDPVIRALQVAMAIPLLAAICGIWNAYLCVRSGRGWAVKSGNILVALAMLGVIWIAYIGGLMTFTLNY